LELNQKINIGEGDSSLALGMTWHVCCLRGKQIIYCHSESVNRRKRNLTI